MIKYEFSLKYDESTYVYTKHKLEQKAQLEMLSCQNQEEYF